ncbi:hypothetical protein ACWD25_15315 [Streptomyces sp. NPDC002920]
MSGHATSLVEWAQMVSLAVSLYAAVSAPYFLLVDAEVWAWPRPLTAAVDRVLATRPGTRLVVAASNIPAAARDLYRDAAALVLLLTTAPKGALR